MQGPSKEEQAQMLNLLGIDEKTFRDYVQKGKSLAEIAKRQNVEVQRVVDLLEAQLKEHAREQAEQMVNQKPMMPPPPKPER
jgi:predicted RecB family nuclease